MKKILLFIFLLCVAFPVFGQTREFASLDAVAYLRGTDSVEVEAYYSVVEKSLKFSTSNEKNWTATIKGEVLLIQDGKEVSRQGLNKTKTFTGTKAELDSHSFDVVLDAAFFRVPAKTDTKVILVTHSVSAQNQPLTDSVLRQVYIPKHKTDKMVFGGIELASSIQKTTNNTSIFEKLGYVILPNPANLYGGNYQKLYYYTEVALPTETAASGEKVEVITRVLDPTDHEMFKTSQPISLDAVMVPVMGSISIDGLPSDAYTLELSIMRNGKVESIIQRGFYYDSGIDFSEESEPVATSKGGVDEQTIYLTSDFNMLGEFELAERADQTKYLMSDVQRNDFKKLTELDAKRHFLYDFWRAKDAETPNSQPLFAYRNFVRRIEMANKQFTIMKTPGWKTSRGRVLIEYGVPDEIQRQSFSIDTKPYFIWEYAGRNIALQSGSRAQFVFVDKQGGGNFVLVSSNAKGETYEADWYGREALQTTN
ncbi:MAG TPA: GWxTD domain-containing protein [Candidatus Kapabacteria bacterium]|nr:GWxTD domain-containing protein [Candidatus Kapabacteria bacterium]